jgi:hypothetical protein
MKRHLMTLILSGFVGALVLSGNAEACHKKKCACAPAPCAVVQPVPCPPPAPVCQPTCAPARKKCGLFSCFKGVKMPKLGHHKKACAPAPCGEVIVYNAPVTYSAPVYSSPQASPQASAQQ